MKILQICHRIPFPPVDGGNIAMLNLAQSLRLAGHELHQFALNTSKHYINPDSLPQSFRTELFFRHCYIDTKLTLTGIIGNFFRKDSYNVSRFNSVEAEKILEAILRENTFDIIQLETLFTTPYIGVIRRNSRARVVLRAHNVEHIIWELLALREPNFLKQRYLKFLSQRLKKYELDVLSKIDALVPITGSDELVFRKLGFDGKMISIQLGINLDEYPEQSDTYEKISLFHLGSMDWMPNQEALEWFLKKCWPLIHEKYPDLMLFLAGRGFPLHIMDANYPNVVCEGRIENANDYMRGKKIMIVPLLSGSGMRVKIIQGMALGKTIISTTIGAEGISCKDGENILIADTPDEFLEKITFCMNDPARCMQIGKAARKLAKEVYSNEVIGKKLSEFYKELTDDKTASSIREN